jgi:hypothetical protein
MWLWGKHVHEAGSIVRMVATRSPRLHRSLGWSRAHAQAGVHWTTVAQIA